MSTRSSPAWIPIPSIPLIVTFMGDRELTQITMNLLSKRSKAVEGHLKCIFVKYTPIVTGSLYN